MKHATTVELFSYWTQLRAERSAPERADIEPAAIRTVLADTFILEADADLACPMRVVGARLSALFGRELKGDNFLALWRETDREAVRSIVSSVLDDASPAIAGAIAAPEGRPSVVVELVLLPLRHYGRTHARLLGALSPGSIPSWLGLLPCEPLTLTSMRMLGAGLDSSDCANSSMLGADAARPRLEAGAPVRRRHLLVHSGGR